MKCIPEAFRYKPDLLKDVNVFCADPLRCSVCSDHLTNWYYEKDGKLYCRKHYWEKFGELCHGCSLLMTGPAMVSSPSHSHSF